MGQGRPTGAVADQAHQHSTVPGAEIFTEVKQRDNN